jgi:hypothetical protein
MTHKPHSIFEAARQVLTTPVTEAVKIAPFRGGYGREMHPKIAETLQTILDSVVDKERKISDAQFFASGYTGVSFKVDGVEYTLTLSLTRMGADDVVPGNMTLTQSGSLKSILHLKGDDSLNSKFPTMGDIGKMSRAISNLL